MVKIKFKYRDAMSNWEWREQECVMSSVLECIKIYGLGVDCDYEIIETPLFKKGYITTEYTEIETEHDQIDLDDPDNTIDLELLDEAIRKMEELLEDNK